MDNKKIAIVTGASTGIGKYISTALAKEGYKVYLLSRNLEKLEKVKKSIEESGGEAEVYQIDLSIIQQVKDFIVLFRKNNESLNVLVNCAAIWHSDSEAFANKDYSTFEQKTVIDTMNVGIMALVILTHGLIDIMPKDSSIINISGTFENGAKGWLPYYVSKKAIEDLTIGLSEEVKSKSIKVNCISPSDTSTAAYRKFFPEYIKDSISPQVVTHEVLNAINADYTGVIKVVKKTN